MLKTLAASTATVTKMARKYKTGIDHHDGPRGCLLPGHGRARRQEATGRPLRRDPPETPVRTAIINDRKPPQATAQAQRADPPAPRRTVRALRVTDGTASPPRPETRRPRQARAARPNRPGSDLMAKRKRKTLVVCDRCHQDIHAGRATSHHPEVEHWRAGCGESPPVRFGKGPSEKDPDHGHLVGGLLHPGGGSRETTVATPAPRPRACLTAPAMPTGQRRWRQPYG